MVGNGEVRRGSGGSNTGRAVAVDRADAAAPAGDRLEVAYGESCMIQAFPD
jgi:hypothetical protein